MEVTPPRRTHLHIGFIGTGRIARAIISGLTTKDELLVACYDRDPKVIQALSDDYPVMACQSASEVASRSEVIILAVKPYQIGEVLDGLRPSLTPNHLVISVAAGISTAFIAERVPEGTRVVRVMPNTPAFVGKGMAAICRGPAAGEEDERLAESLFRSIGRARILDEAQMDAATALSGSGPAYMFHIIADLAEGGIACGLEAEDALELAAQTMLGAATMVLEGGRDPEELKRQVTTPGGTTEAGLKVMDGRGIREILIDTVKAAANRSREMKQ